MVVDLTIDLDMAREYAIQRLGALKKGNVEKVMKRSLKRAAEAYRSSTIKETKKKYILKDKSIKQNMKVETVSEGFLVRTSTWSRLITHYDFGKANTKKGRKKNKSKNSIYYGARVLKKSKKKYIPNSFWISSEQEKGILLRRPEGLTGKVAHPKRLNKWLVLGPAVGEIVKNPETVDISEKRAKEILHKRIDYEVNRILSGMA